MVTWEPYRPRPPLNQFDDVLRRRLKTSVPRRRRRIEIVLAYEAGGAAFSHWQHRHLTHPTRRVLRGSWRRRLCLHNSALARDFSNRSSKIHRRLEVSISRTGPSCGQFAAFWNDSKDDFKVAQKYTTGMRLIAVEGSAGSRSDAWGELKVKNFIGGGKGYSGLSCRDPSTGEGPKMDFFRQPDCRGGMTITCRLWKKTKGTTFKNLKGTGRYEMNFPDYEAVQQGQGAL
jgi:hypothetical protein